MVYMIKIMLFFIFLGASFNKSINDTGQKNLMKSLYRRVSVCDFSFIEKYSEGKDGKSNESKACKYSDLKN